MSRSASQALPPLPDYGQQVLIVDDSAVARAVFARMIDASDGFVTAGSVATAGAAHEFLQRHRVDIVMLSLSLTGGEGMAALSGLIAAARDARVLVVTGSAAHFAAASIQALALGAADTLIRPESQALDRRFAATLIDRLERLGTTPRSTPIVAATSTAGRQVQAAPTASAASSFDLIAIGASTGGIHAMSQVLRALPHQLRTPILITQHLPGNFMPYFAAQLAVLAGRPCHVAEDHTRVVAGNVYVAPGDAHLRCVRLPDQGVALRLLRERTVSGCTPSVDPMLGSAAALFGERLLAVVLSGMGRDGSDGARAAYEAGATVVVQDQASSVIWGMPGAVTAAGHASAILSPDAIGALIASGRRP